MSDEELRLRGAGLEWRAVDGEVVALDIAASAYLAVNPSGRQLWEALAQGTTRPALVKLLSDGHGLDTDRAERDVDAFLAELERRELLERSAAGAAPDDT